MRVLPPVFKYLLHRKYHGVLEFTDETVEEEEVEFAERTGDGDRTNVFCEATEAAPFGVLAF